MSTSAPPGATSAAQSLAKLVAYFSQVQVFEGVESQFLTTDSIEGSGIGANYHAMIKRLLADDKNKWTHICSIEDDHGFEPDTLHCLARRKLPIVGATYKTNKGWPVRWTAIGLDQKPLGTNKNKSGIEEAYLIPQGFTLVAREVYENTPKPWFLQGYYSERDEYSFMADYYFCLQAAKAGFKCYVDHDASKKLWHTGTKLYHWDARDEKPFYVKRRKGNGCNIERSL